MKTRPVLAAALLLLTGCAHRAPQAISLPSTVPVRRALAVATSSNARALQIVERAQKIGIAAGSADLHDLTAALARHDDAARHDEGGARSTHRATAGQTADRGRADAIACATLTTKYNAAVKSLWHYRLWFWGPLALALVAVGVLVAAKFTAWGARTLGPYLVDAEHLAVKAAVVA